MHSATFHRAHHTQRVMTSHPLPLPSSRPLTSQPVATNQPNASRSTRAYTSNGRGPTGSGIHRLAMAGSANVSSGGEAKRDAAQLLLWTINEWSKNKSQVSGFAGSQGHSSVQGHHISTAESRRARRIQRKVPKHSADYSII